MRPGDLCAVVNFTANLWDSRRSPASVIEEVPLGGLVLVLGFKKDFEVKVLSPNGVIGWMKAEHLEVWSKAGGIGG